MSTAGSNLQAAALKRARLTRKRLPRRAQLRASSGGYWYAYTNYGVEVIGLGHARAAAHLTQARYAIGEVLNGVAYVDWID